VAVLDIMINLRSGAVTCIALHLRGSVTRAPLERFTIRGSQDRARGCSTGIYQRNMMHSFTSSVEERWSWGPPK
jgi:hypothetical protein